MSFLEIDLTLGRKKNNFGKFSTLEEIDFHKKEFTRNISIFL